MNGVRICEAAARTRGHGQRQGRAVAAGRRETDLEQLVRQASLGEPVVQAAVEERVGRRERLVVRVGAERLGVVPET